MLLVMAGEKKTLTHMPGLMSHKQTARPNWFVMTVFLPTFSLRSSIMVRLPGAMTA